MTRVSQPLSWLVLLITVMLASPLAAQPAQTDGQGTDNPWTAGEAARLAMIERTSAAVVAVVNDRLNLGGNTSIGGGSGFIIDADGTLITSTLNVPASASECRVLMSDGRERRAQVIGRDPLNTVLLARIRAAETDPEEWPHLTFGDSRAVAVGETVYAFGNPYATIVNDHTVGVSRGVISGMYRPIVHERNPQRALQRVGAYRGRVLETDCGINDGSWGGPLTDAGGAVIGMICKVVDYRRWLGTAVPIHQIQAAMTDLQAGETPSAGWHGLTLEAFDEHLTVTAVAEDSPAAAAGLAVGDVILTLDTEPIPTPAAFDAIITQCPVGTVLIIEFRRTTTAADAAQTEHQVATLELTTPPQPAEAEESPEE